MIVKTILIGKDSNFWNKDNFVTIKQVKTELLQVLSLLSLEKLN